MSYHPEGTRLPENVVDPLTSMLILIEVPLPCGVGSLE
jgi:hypothetical protein